MPNLNSGVLEGVRRIGASFRSVSIGGGLPGAPSGFRIQGALTAGPPVSGTWRAGDHVEDRNGVIWICTTGGNPGSWKSTAQRDAYMRASSVQGETLSRAGQLNGTYGTGSSGTLSMFAIFLPAGVPVGHLAFATGTAGIVGPTHWWYGLYDQNLNQLAVTADQTTTALASGTYQSLAVATTAAGSASSFTTTYTGLHYIGAMIAYSTTAPNLLSIQQNGTPVIAQAPVLAGTSDTGQSTPPAFPHQATALTAVAFIAYGAAAT